MEAHADTTLEHINIRKYRQMATYIRKGKFKLFGSKGEIVTVRSIFPTMVPSAVDECHTACRHALMCVFHGAFSGERDCSSQKNCAANF